MNNELTNLKEIIYQIVETELKKFIEKNPNQINNSNELSQILLNQKEHTLQQNEINETQKQIKETTDRLSKCSPRQVKRIKQTVYKRYNDVLSVYEKKARKIIYGNIQGDLYKKFLVNTYEDLLATNYERICEFASSWIPTVEVEMKIEKYKINHEQLDLLE